MEDGESQMLPLVHVLVFVQANPVGRPIFGICYLFMYSSSGLCSRTKGSHDDMKTNGVKVGPGKRVGVLSLGDLTSIELVGRDRPALLSEMSTILANLHCNVVAAEVWTHNMRVACVLSFNDDTTGCAVEDPIRLSAMEEQLKNILRGCEDDGKVARTSFSIGFTHMDRCLHQMMLVARDYKDGGVTEEKDYAPAFQPVIIVDCCEDKGYSMVNV
ncbi:ACT domain-containing protein ACR3-like [Macadamia integrifolia]|uniref:ACT domain-containing protein ACR3-like n=1 Tax=Macadamia integrifolia TaxID=60698 RepID=UPI001C52802D|nr:ACT domain-containing protein ACR3-like [Macadamia integrifolia]